MNYPLDASSIVLDLGGYEGQWASDIFSMYCCKVFVFEPVEAFAEGIRARFAGNPSIQVFTCGLGASTRDEQISVSADDSSMYTKSGPLQTIRIVDAVAWLKERAIQKIHLVKINIEGGEYELLDRLIAADLIGSIDNLQIQFHDISPEARGMMEKIQGSLAKTHELTYRYDFVWENWRRRVSP